MLTNKKNSYEKKMANENKKESVHSSVRTANVKDDQLNQSDHSLTES